MREMVICEREYVLYIRRRCVICVRECVRGCVTCVM